MNRTKLCQLPDYDFVENQNPDKMLLMRIRVDEPTWSAGMS